MTTGIVEPRWIAPPGLNVHPRLALVKHDNRLFSYSELLSHLMVQPDPALASGPFTPQECWDELLSRLPSVAKRAAAMSRPLDFEVLDLYAVPAAGSA